MRAVLLLALALPSWVLGAAYDVEARTEAQFYGVKRFTPVAGEWQVLPRRRLVQYLDLAGFELVPGEDAGLSFVLRLDADFGVSQAEAAGLDDAYRDRLQLLAGRVHWKGMAGGRLDLEAGRIAALDRVSFFSFDGVRATVRPARWLALTAFGGLRVEGASWLGSSSSAPDGVRDSDARRLAAGAIPCSVTPGPACADPSLTEPAPTWGGRFALTELPAGLASGADVEYRRTLRQGGVIEERLEAGLRWQRGSLFADAVGEYDLYLARLTALRASLRWAALRSLQIGLESAYWHTSFSSDSIFNLFDTSPWREAWLRVQVAPEGSGLRLHAAGGAQWVEPTRFGETVLGDQGAAAPEAALGASYQWGSTTLVADWTWRGGDQGRSYFLSGVVRRTFRGWLAVEGRAALASVTDPVVASESGTFASAALTVTGRLERRAQMAVLVESSATRFGGSDLRLYAFLVLGADWETRLR